MGNFQFALGSLSSTDFAGTAYPSTKIEINLKGSPKNIVAFVHEIVKTMPICEVISLNISQGNADLIMLFYYKPFTAQDISDQTGIVPLSASDLNLISNISSWNTAGENPLAGLLFLRPVLRLLPARLSNEVGS